MEDKTPHPDEGKTLAEIGMEKVEKRRRNQAEGETLSVAEQYRKNHPNPETRRPPTLAERIASDENLAEELKKDPELRKKLEAEEAELLRKYPPPDLKEMMLFAGWAPLEDYTPEEQNAIIKGKDSAKEYLILSTWAKAFHGDSDLTTQETIASELTEAFPEFGELWKELSEKERTFDVNDTFGRWYSLHFPTFRASTKAAVLYYQTEEGRDFLTWAGNIGGEASDSSQTTTQKPKAWLEEFHAWRKEREKKGLPAPERINVLCDPIYSALMTTFNTPYVVRREEGERWPSAPIKTNTIEAWARIQPPPAELEMGLSGEEIFSEVTEAQRTKMNPLTADVLDAVFYLWATKNQGPGKPIWITADDILALRGREKHDTGKGKTYKTEDKREILQHLAILHRIYIEIINAEIIENGKKTRIKGTFGLMQIEGWTEKTELSLFEKNPPPTEWRAWVKPGALFEGALTTQDGQQIAFMSRKILEFNPYRQKMEKIFGRQFTRMFKIRISKNQANVFRVKTLLEWNRIDLEKKQRYDKLYARFDKALDTLREAGIIAGWEYGPGWDEFDRRKKKDYKEWLKLNVIITPTEWELQKYEKITTPKRKALAAPKTPRRPKTRKP